MIRECASRASAGLRSAPAPSAYQFLGRSFAAAASPGPPSPAFNAVPSPTAFPHVYAPSEQHDVVVIGSGPVGLAVAREYALSGRKVTMLEQRHEGEASAGAGGWAEGRGKGARGLAVRAKELRSAAFPAGCHRAAIEGRWKSPEDGCPSRKMPFVLLSASSASVRV